MNLNWEKLSNLLDKKPMSVLLGLCLSMTIWAVWNWRDEVREHKQDLRKTYESLERTNELQYRMIQLMQENNEQRWKQDTAK